MITWETTGLEPLEPRLIPATAHLQLLRNVVELDAEVSDNLHALRLQPELKSYLRILLHNGGPSFLITGEEIVRLFRRTQIYPGTVVVEDLGEYLNNQLTDDMKSTTDLDTVQIHEIAVSRKGGGERYVYVTPPVDEKIQEERDFLKEVLLDYFGPRGLERGASSEVWDTNPYVSSVWLLSIQGFKRVRTVRNIFDSKAEIIPARIKLSEVKVEKVAPKNK